MAGGNGTDIRVWKDNWLPRESCFRVITPPPAIWDEETTVDKLICPVTRRYDQSVLEHIFNAEVVELIQSIPLSCRSINDRLIWHHEKNGRFSVLSAYHVARQDVSLMGVETE